jgi:hypothetical protein
MRDYRRPSDLSRHFVLELIHARHHGHVPRPMLRSEVLWKYLHGMQPAERRETLGVLMSDPPLGPGEPVPGCSCEWCTGISKGHPARQTRRRWSSPRPGRESWSRRVEEARSVPVLEVARALGLKPKKAGKEYMASCPLHEDATPSLSLNPRKAVWHCFSCGRGGDGIALVMEVRRVNFQNAVREITGDVQAEKEVAHR